MTGGLCKINPHSGEKTRIAGLEGFRLSIFVSDKSQNRVQNCGPERFVASISIESLFPFDGFCPKKVGRFIRFYNCTEQGSRRFTAIAV
jgi:hypothetical protein